MVLKEYWLIKHITTIGHRNSLQIVDQLNANGIREAEKDFKNRNNFKKLAIKCHLIIARSERWFE